MAQLGAEGVLDTPHIPELSSAQPERAPPAEEAIGGRVTIHFAGVGEWCRGEVLAYSAAKQVSLSPHHGSSDTLAVCTLQWPWHIGHISAT